MNRSLFAPDALLPAGWSRDVLLTWDAEGAITAAEPGSAPGGAEIASGPVIPGMANVHSHAFQRAMAGLAETRGHPTDTFWTWREEMYKLVLTLTPEDIEAIAGALYVEMLRHGYTSVAEFHYLHHQPDGRPYADPAELSHRIIAAARYAGIALTHLPVLYAYGGFGHKPLGPAQRRFAGNAESIVQLASQLARGYAGDPDLRFGIAPHSARAVDALMLQEVVEAMDAIDATAPIHMHASEQVGEVEECRGTHGVTPLEWICEIAPVDRRWCFIHATHITAGERSRVTGANATVGLCPMTEANLGDGIFPFAGWFAGDGSWAIGGDSHVSVSPFEELRQLEYSQRLATLTRNVSAGAERPDVAGNLWSAAAAGGARASGRNAGRISPGARADLVVLDGDDTDFTALDAPRQLAVAMFSGNANRVRDVFVSGRRIVKDGFHAAEDDARERFAAALGRLRAR
jgi:formimidoylglutamate deiminase